MKIALSPQRINQLSGPHQEAFHQLRKCVHCGFCNSICPTYEITGNELDGPRGRIYLIKGLLEGQSDTAVVEQHLDRCLTCGACESRCPSQVEYLSLAQYGRMQLEDQRSWLSKGRRRFVAWFFQTKLLFPLLWRLASFFTCILPRSFSRRLSLSQSPLAPLPISTSSISTSSTSSISSSRVDKHQVNQIDDEKNRQPDRSITVLVLTGCVQSTTTPGTVHHLKQLLTALGIRVMVNPQEVCCGALPLHLGDHDQAKRRMRRNILMLDQYLNEGVNFIVSSASGCGSMYREYDQHFAQDDVLREKAERIQQAFRDVIALFSEATIAHQLTQLARAMAERPPTSNQAVQTTHPTRQPRVIIHQPCTLAYGRAKKQQNPVIEIATWLSRFGYQIVDTDDTPACCGSAGSYSLLQADLSDSLLQAKAAAYQAASADIVVTANVGCQLHLQSAMSIPVKHWIELLRC